MYFIDPLINKMNKIKIFKVNSEIFILNKKTKNYTV